MAATKAQRTFIGYEYEALTMDVTGVEETYQGASIKEAIKSAVYTHRCTQPTHAGPSGQVIYYGNKCMAFPQPKS